MHVGIRAKSRNLPIVHSENFYGKTATLPLRQRHRRRKQLKHLCSHIFKFKIVPSEKPTPNPGLIGDHHNAPATESSMLQQGRHAWTERHTSWITEVVPILYQDSIAIEK